MGEACEIAKILGVPVSFSAFKGADGSLKIHYLTFENTIPEAEQHAEEKDLTVDGGTSVEKQVKKEITMKEFYREYRKLKRM